MKFRLLLFSVMAIILLIFVLPELSVEKRKNNADVTALLSVENDDNNYSRAIKPRKFVFPADYGAHNDFKSEWWYFTGNLDDKEGRHFGYQITIFRQAISPEKVKSSSLWSTNQIYLAHFSISDIQDNKFYSYQKISRASIGLAGAQADPMKIWVENWQIKKRGDSVFLKAASEEVLMDLRLISQKPVVLQGDKGLSQKSSAIGNASYYYSQTRLATTGQIKIGSKSFQVTGSSWMDREWSTSSLSKNEVGWDWFSLQLDNGKEVMIYSIRKRDGSINDYSSGVLVAQNGKSTKLAKGDFEIHVLDTWMSERTKISYPSKWLLRIPKHKLEYTLTPYINDQEHRFNPLYWEGAVKVDGNDSSGWGYVELVGYTL